MLLSTRFGLLTQTCLENNSALESRHKNKASGPIVRVAGRGKRLHTPCLAARKRQHHSARDLSAQIYIVPDVNHFPIWLPKTSTEMTEVYHQMLRVDSKANTTHQMTSSHITEKLQTKYSFCQNREMKESVWFKSVSWDLTQTTHLPSSKTQLVDPSAWSWHSKMENFLFAYLFIVCVRMLATFVIWFSLSTIWLSGDEIWVIGLDGNSLCPLSCFNGPWRTFP